MKKKFCTVILMINILFTLLAIPTMIDDPFPSEENLAKFSFTNENNYSEEFLNNSTINLITVDPGKEVFSYFGHTALELITPTLEPIFFDTGVFTLTDTFIQDLLQGKLYFGAYQSYGENNRRLYESENRNIITLPLNLDNDNKAGVIDYTNYNAKRENHIYLYDYYLDNCATRIRDIINKTTDGKLEEFGLSINEGTTFRKLTTDYMSKNWLINFTFNFLEGPSIDKPITRYEAAFIPERLNALVSDYQTGNITEKEYPLFSSTFSLLLESFTISTVIALTIYLLMQSKKVVSNRLANLLACFIFLYLTVLSSVLLYMQNFSYHQVTYYNENLLIVSPLVLILSIEHLVKVFKPSHKTKLATFVLYFSITTATTLIVLKGIFADTFSQNNFYVFSFVVPLYIFEVVSRKEVETVAIKGNNYFYYF